MSITLTSAGFGGNFVLSRAGAATANVSGITGAATTLAAQAITFTIGGKLYYATAATIGTVTPTVDYVTGAAFKTLGRNQGCVFVWGLTSAGALKVIQGPMPVQAGTTGVVTNVDDSGNWSLTPQFPAIPDDICPIAYTVVRAASTYAGTGFRFGSDNWNTTGITAVTQDLFALPAVPQIS